MSQKHIKEIVAEWFNIWEEGDFYKLPLSEDFIHTSPYGVIEGKKKYLDIVSDNKEMFLGNRFKILDAIYDENKASVRYIMESSNAFLNVSEWLYIKEGKISAIISYYNKEEEKKAGRGITIPQ
ncbi:nuclear transport factor 2 family protein [Aquimarina rhabdastrellae]